MYGETAVRSSSISCLCPVPAYHHVANPAQPNPHIQITQVPNPCQIAKSAIPCVHLVPSRPVLSRSDRSKPKRSMFAAPSLQNQQHTRSGARTERSRRRAGGERDSDGAGGGGGGWEVCDDFVADLDPGYGRAVRELSWVDAAKVVARATQDMMAWSPRFSNYQSTVSMVIVR